MKCLPVDKVRQAQGNVLHDSHAEVLALRAFNRWVLDQCREVLGEGGQEGKWVRRTTGLGRGFGVPEGDGDGVVEGEEYGEGNCARRPFALQPGVRVHMYCSQAPCGDASMELTMAAQEDATPWAAKSVPLSSSSPDAIDSTAAAPTATTALPGRAHFDQLGIVRRKPARPDAPPTLSKSCSDKLALKQFTSLLSGVVSLLVETGNAYLTSLVLPRDQCVPEAMQRAFGADGRLKGVTDDERRLHWQKGYAFRPFEVKTTSRRFQFAREAAEGIKELPPAASNLAALATPERREVLIAGILQGRKQGDPKGASCVSRRRVWEAAVEVAVAAGLNGVGAVLGRRGLGYGGLKAGSGLAGRRKVKADVRERGLRGWIRNEGDDGWGLG
ncbi:hypothetical protein MBLNU230_g0170t1 [Neophaeotheca triangularis]